MNDRPFPRPKCPEGLCIFYSIPLPRVNVQTPYRFQSFLSQYVSLLDTKSPGERGAPRGKSILQFCELSFIRHRRDNFQCYCCVGFAIDYFSGNTDSLNCLHSFYNIRSSITFGNFTQGLGGDFFCLIHTINDFALVIR